MIRLDVIPVRLKQTFPFLQCRTIFLFPQSSTPQLTGGLRARIITLASLVLTLSGLPDTLPKLDPFLLVGRKSRGLYITTDVTPLCSYSTFWQYANSGPNPGDQNIFNGDSAGLRR